MSKWTKWLPWADHTVIANERYKILFENGTIAKTTGMKIIQIGYDDFELITHYKRLRANVEAEGPEGPYDDYTHIGLLDKIDGLESNLSAAIDVAFMRGATEWCRLNHPDDYDRLSARERCGDEHKRSMAALKESGQQPVVSKVGEYVTSDGESVTIIRDDGEGHKYRFYGTIKGRKSFWSQEGFDYQGGAAIVGPYVVTDEDIDPTPIITGPGEYKTVDGRKGTVTRITGDDIIFGTLDGECWSWDRKGMIGNDPMCPENLVAPWVEPKPVKPEQWANLYFSDGVYGLGLGRASSKEGCLHIIAEGVGKHIGAVLLSHTMEEE